MPTEFDSLHMARALELAARGEGLVEPNPMVGCTIVRDGETVGEGFHARFGGPHAETEALQVARAERQTATVYVTLEPCCHQGQTPPCTQALIRAGVARVVVAQRDPFSKVNGQGIVELEQAGIEVEVGTMAAEAAALNAPYLKLVGTGRPWVIAKWATTLGGKLASRSGDSRWISGEASRAVVHRLRGRMDAIVVGRGTVVSDDPLLTARPPGARTAARVVLDSHASLASDCQLVRTARDSSVMIAASAAATAADRRRLEAAGCEVLICAGATWLERLGWLLDEFGRRRMTNVLFEGGSQVFGCLFDLSAIDEVHAFIAPKLIGGQDAPSAIGGAGIDSMARAVNLVSPQIQTCDDDVYVHGRISR